VGGKTKSPIVVVENQKKGTSWNKAAKEGEVPIGFGEYKNKNNNRPKAHEALMMQDQTKKWW
jgi:hypothetical protein